MRRHINPCHNLRATAAVVALLGLALQMSACGDGSDESGPATTALEAPAPSTDGSSPATAPSYPVTAAWPHDWTAKTVGGGQFDAGDYAGQDLVLWFWAPW